jgi:predicted RNA polymerase sigma factor
MHAPAIQQVPDVMDVVYRSDSRCVLATLIRLLGDFDLAVARRRRFNRFTP